MSDASANFQSSSPLADSGVQRGWIKCAIAFTVGLGAILALMDVSMVRVALRYIQSGFDATSAEISWVMSGYGLASVVAFALAAGLGDRLGRAKAGFLFALLVFLLASILCGLASSASMLIAARVLQGLAGGALLAKMQSILFRTFSTAGQGTALTVIGLSAIVLGPVLGPTLGGYLVDNFSWRWIFWMNIPFGILAGILALLFLPAGEPDRRNRPWSEWASIAFTTAALVGWNFFTGGSHS
jgi:MFS transporter, DHA2 family, multidrug resistance protein